MYLALITEITNESRTEYIRRLPEFVGYGVADLASNYVRQYGLAEDYEGQPAIKRIVLRFTDRDSVRVDAFAEGGNYHVNITTNLNSVRARYFVQEHFAAISKLENHQHIVVSEEFFRKLY